MCGFAGIVLADPGARADGERVRAMARTLAHRGPDDEHVELDGPCALGFRRLSVIDVAGGRQPIRNETGDVIAMCNGEIYNFEELRAGLESRGHRFRTGSDVETVVHLYEEHGERLAEHLVGMFAFCVVDLRDRARPRVLLGRDRLGIKPLYVARTGTALAFASEPKALLAGGFGSRRVHGEKLLDYLVQGFVGGTDSIWEGIERLPQASTLAWSAGETPRTRRYWDLPLDGPRAPASSDEILELLDRVVRDHLLSDVPLGAFLSGGIDSNAVADAMARARGMQGRSARSLDRGLVLCSVGFREGLFDELPRARASAQRLGATHHVEVLEPDPKLALDVLPWLFDEPLADPSTVPTHVVSWMAREHVTVALTGDGGDEVFAGYRRYVFDVAENRVRRFLGRPGRSAAALAGRAYPKLDRAPRFLRAKSTLENLGRDPAHAYFASVTQMSRDEALSVLAPELASALREHDPFAAFETLYRRPRYDDPLYRAQYADVFSFLPDQILVKGDRASMGASLEVRPPLLDHRFVERFANLPAHEKVRAGRGKHALREALRSRLPSEILDGRKMGFDVPLRDWLRGPLAPSVAEAIAGADPRWFDPRALRARFDEHQSGARDRSHLLWSVLVLERWRQRHSAGEIVLGSVA